jgi:hypothetical protein
MSRQRDLIQSEPRRLALSEQIVGLARASGDNLIEEVSSRAVLDLYDPNIRIESQFARETLLDLGFRCWLGQTPAE